MKVLSQLQKIIESSSTHIKVKTITVVITFIISNLILGCTVQAPEQGASPLIEEEKKETTIYLNPGTDITKDFRSGWTYLYSNIRLSGNYISLDADSNTISKKDFLLRLGTGDFFPFLIMYHNKLPVYKLSRMKIEPDLRSTLLQYTADARRYYDLKGKKIGKFSFTDLNGNNFTNENTKGKVVIIKCWFIKCVACVEEFPEVNKIASRYSNNPGVLFISLALDKPADLRVFLNTHPLNYNVVGSQKNFLENSVLKVTSYPSHYIIDKDGIIVNGSENLKDIVFSIEEALKR